VLQDENVKRKESLKRKAVPEKGAKDGAASKRPKKEWWDKDARGNQGYEDDDDVEHYRREVCALPPVPFTLSPFNFLLGSAPLLTPALHNLALSPTRDISIKYTSSAQPDGDDRQVGLARNRPGHLPLHAISV
jgi:hypothetical protein